ncbi:MAG: DUF4339 domain-containing protein [Robiginitomaculum sp.]|nr:DUF4339 domain-containing protein [Robiginitomaculum sp.]
MHWYVNVQNQAYGPYSDAQMQGFVSEGRVNDQSIISNSPENGYYQAIAYDIFKLWSGTGQSIAVGAETQTYPHTQGRQTYQQTAHSPQPMTYNAQPAHSPAPTHNIPSSVPEAIAETGPVVQTPTEVQGKTNVFLVMAEIRSEGAMGFLQALQGFGSAQRIGDTVWILRSASGVEKLRNVLSQALDRQDRLFILDSSANKTAWFNIGADLDHRIRELWSEDDD